MARGQSFRDFLEGEFATGPELRAEIEEALDDVRLAVELATYRERLGITQQALSHATGIPQPMISRIERGDQQPTWPTLRKLLSGLEAVLVAEPDGSIQLHERAQQTGGESALAASS